MPAITDLLFTSETTKDITSTRKLTNVKKKKKKKKKKKIIIIIIIIMKNKVQHIPRGAFLVTGTSLNRTCSKSAGPDQDGLVDLPFWRIEIMFCGCTFGHK